MRLCVGAIFVLAAILIAPLASAQPVNLRGRLIDPSAPYLQQVATLQTLRERGYLNPTLASTQMFPTLDASLTALRASRFGGSLHPRAIRWLVSARRKLSHSVSDKRYPTLTGFQYVRF